MEKFKIIVFLLICAIVLGVIGAIVPEISKITGFFSKASIVCCALVILYSVFSKFFGDF